MIAAESIRSSLRTAAFLSALGAAVFLRVQVPRWAEAGLAAAIAKTASLDPELEALRTPIVVLDAGHGGMDGGTAANGVQEKDAALDLARRIEKRLREQGISVRMTRHGDAYVELGERCALAAKSNASVFVSIHLNSSSARGVSGIETYYSSQRVGSGESMARALPGAAASGTLEDHRSELLAGSIQRRACAATGASDRGVRDSRLYVVQHASCPAVLVECGYLTQADEARRLKREGYRDKLAAAIADGIRRYLIATSINPRRGFGVPAADRSMAAARGS